MLILLCSFISFHFDDLADIDRSKASSANTNTIDGNKVGNYSHTGVVRGITHLQWGSALSRERDANIVVHTLMRCFI